MQGAIRVTSGNCVFHNLCGYSCEATSRNCAFSAVNSDSNSINYAVDCSISNCVALSSSSSYGYGTMYHYYGNIFIKSVNLSHNNCNYYSAIDCRPNKAMSEGSETFGTIISYSSFKNNTAEKYITIYLYNSAYNHKINNSNIIENKQNNPTSSYNGLIYTYGETTIQNSYYNIES